jgi:hypothetical protein
MLELQDIAFAQTTRVVLCARMLDILLLDFLIVRRL